MTITSFDLAQIDWGGDGVPRSRVFDDIYYSPQDGLAESRYVFCDAMSDDPTWWQRELLTIAETGFGSGLNFLTCWQKWQSLAPTQSRLHFVSAEAFPMTKNDLIKALNPWPELSDLSKQLIDKYPVLHPGFHRLNLDNGRVTLTLLFGEATSVYKELVATVDGWFLDGFTPSKNPDIWSESLIAQIARLSHPGTRLSTFTAASHVRQKLEDFGFQISKTKGFGFKRECLRGEFKTRKVKAPTQSMPWFHLPKPLPKQSTIAIIGAGIAGISCYQALKRSGFNANIYEANSFVGGGGSGNEVGLIQPRLTTSDSMDGQFNATAYLNAIRYYDDISQSTETPIWHGERGGIQLARNEAEATRYEKLTLERRLPQSEMDYFNAEELSEIAGVKVKEKGLFYQNAGSLRPKNLLKELSADIDIQFNVTISAIEKAGNQWQLQDSAGNSFATADAVIIANAHMATKIFEIKDVPLTSKRGQVTYIPATAKSEMQRCGISFGNYITPCFIDSHQKCYHLVGASYRALASEDKDNWQALSIEDHQNNIESIQNISDDFSIPSPTEHTLGRVAVRATTVDHLPVVGVIHNGMKADEIYHDLRHGKPAENYPEAPYHESLYCITGLGSRGFQTAPLLASALADLMTGAPNILERRFLDALHPIRFQIRKLKRKKGR